MIPRFLLPSLFILSSPMSQVWKIAARKEGEENISDYFLLILFYHGEVKVARLSLTLCDPIDSTLQAPLSLGFSRPEYWSG